MKGPPTDFWGKLSGEGDALQWHPLADHCADVAACAEALLRHTALGARLAALAGVQPWSEEQIARLCVFAALHDVGKFNTGFQARWRTPRGRGRVGHVGPAVALIAATGEDLQCRFIEALDFPSMERWAAGDGGAERMLHASVSHHGRPTSIDGSPIDLRVWSKAEGLDPMEGVGGLANALRSWYPAAFADRGAPLPDVPALQHAFTGLVTLADWLGSDARRFRFREQGDRDRMEFSREAARESLRALGLAAGTVRAYLPAGLPGFAAVSPHDPRPVQAQIGGLAPAERGSLTILESETGSGKTEAALFHFLRLFHAGAVDGLYFALPTRTAATQIHGRVELAARRMFPSEATRPPVVLAVPGYLRVDGQDGTRDDPRLAPFEVLWNDDDRERWRFRGWAAESPKRYLAGAIAVGTIDQVLLSALAVPHAHMRAVALLRQLLVVDEVHASDTYMTHVLSAVLRRHLASGGHALLLSATLGADARDRFLACADRSHSRMSFEAATRVPYPAISSGGSARVSTKQVDSPPAEGRRISLDPIPIAQYADRVAALALDAARRGGRVLVLRNTVRDALATQRALEAAAASTGASNLLFRCMGQAAPYHARFARADREALDREMLCALKPRVRRDEGVVVVATQTAQQSLDIDADLLITDLCPADVLLQRIGRLHRHADSGRPPDLAVPHVQVLVPESRDLGAFIGRSGDVHGPLGLGFVYEDLRALEATWQLIEESRSVRVPQECRVWVERSTHPDALASVASGLGGRWSDHHVARSGRQSAQRSLAGHQLARWEFAVGDQRCLFPDALEGRVATRLGVSDRRASFRQSVPGAFGTWIEELSIPGTWMSDVPEDAEPMDVVRDGEWFRFRMGVRPLRYSRFGLEKDDSVEASGERAR